MFEVRIKSEEDKELVIKTLSERADGMLVFCRLPILQSE
jgi:hypothetical protein